MDFKEFLFKTSMTLKNNVFISIALWSCSLVLQGTAEPLGVVEKAPLFQSIEQVIATDAVVIAWEEVLDDAREGKQYIGGMSQPELRFRVERDRMDDDVRMGSAIRWRLDESMPKWYRMVEATSLVQLYEYHLRIARDQIRIELKRDCLKFSFLREKLDRGLESLELQQKHLAEQEMLLEYNNVRALAPMKAKLAVATAADDVESIRAELVELESDLIDRGMDNESVLNLDFEQSWQLQGDRPWLEVSLRDMDAFLMEMSYDHPRLAIITLEKDLLKDQRLAKLKRSGLGLSYVQLEYERENDSNRATNDSTIGLSFGVNLPFWNESSRTKRITAKDETDTEFIADGERIRDEIVKSLKEWKLIKSRDLRLRPQMEVLVSELQDLGASLDISGPSLAGEQSHQIKKELIELKENLADLRYKVLLAALELEASLHQPVLFNP